MKRLFAAAFFTSLLHLLPAQAQPGKPGTAPAAKPPAAAPDGRTPSQARPGQVAVSNRYTGHLSADPAQFIVDVGTMMLATNNNAAKLTADKLRQLWGSNTLTSSQQLRIAELSQKLLDKKFRPQPHLAAFYAAIVGGKGQAKLGDAQIDQMLEVLGQSLERDPTGDTEKFLLTTSRVLNGGYLYRSGFNSLRVGGGQFSFAHKGNATEPAPGISFDNPAPAAPTELPAAKPTAAKPVAKAKPKPKPVAKKRASDGWDTGDLWSASPAKKKNDGWGDDGWGAPAPKKKAAANDGWGAPSANDGWGAPAPKKKAPAKTVAKTPAKAPAAKPTAPAAKPANDSFDQPDVPFAPSVAAALAAYYPPAVSGPVIEIKDADIVMGTAGDSMVLHKVSGTAAVLGSRFLATGGQMTWTVKNNPVTAELGPFDFDMGKPEFTAQPVTLTYPYLFESSVKGALSYKAVRRKPANGDTGYPRFISLTNDVRLKNMGEGITYQGGLSMAGERLLSAALDGSLATITVQQEGKRRFRATSRNYVLGDSVITTTRAAVALYEAAHDSITHPGVELKYLKNKQNLKLLQEDGTFRKTPYSDSYHQVDVRAEMVTWNLREPKINFSIYTSPNQVSADFESKNFFSNVRYQQLKSINHLHPLQMLLGYSQDHGKVQTMSVRDVAEAVQIPEANLRSAVVSLARDGYVDVQPKTGEVTLLPKGKHYVGAAREKKDFDHIAIKSLTGSGRSATLNLNSDQLLVRGVEQFSFSDDSAAVIVRPDSGVVRIERNRNLKFSGRVIASAYRFKGKDFQFDYDGYYIDMPHIDSLTIRSKAPKKGAGKAGTRPTDFTLTNKGNTQSGRLFLNDPKNRSGRKKLGKFPAFNSTSGATVFFNKPDVLGGAYDSTTYFDVPPFKFDSMGTGKSRANVVGVFHSKALPPIKTTMTTQEDGSLGFTHTVPATGYALYGGKGKLSGGAKVRLNSQGLQSDGTVTYLGATMQSDRFVMYGDSLTGEGKAGAIAAGPNFPKVTMPPGYLINWNAKSDSLHLLTTEKTAPVKMYADHTFKGGMLLTPKGLGGDGRLDGPQSYVRSESLTFKNDSYSGKKAVLSVKSAQAGKPALTANDTNFTYDLKNGVAEFKRDEGSTASIDLPYAGFRTGLSEGRWDFKKKRVTLKTAAASTGGAYVASTRPEQKGLKFKATSAAYDITKSLLETKGVPYIAAADAWIVPDSGRVSVAGGGKIQTLRRATVLLDSLEKFHKLTGGNITVTSRDAFSGDAKYMSRTATGDSVAMKFTNFKSDSSALVSQVSKKRFRLLRRSTPDAATPISLATTATASVDNNQKFQLAPSIGYRGGISLNSQKRGLIFDGEVQLQFGKQKGASAWFAVQDSIDPKNVVLTLTKPKTEDGAEAVTGLYLSDADNKLYPRYAAPKATDADLPVLPVDGKVRYDAKTGEYTISKIDAADPKQYEGAVLTYNETNGRVNFRGPMNFIVSNKNYSLTAAGVGTANPDSARYQVDALLGFDINITSKAMDVMAANLGQVTKNGQLALDGSSNELYKIGQLAGNKATEAYASRAPNTAPPLLGTVSSKLIHTLTLSRADLRWSPKQKAWHSVGKIGIAGINKRGLNALVDGYIEIKRENSTDQVEVYLEADPQTWYYIRYANNIVVAMSSSETFNNQVGGKAKGDANTATEFGVFLGDYSDVDGFRSHFERDYLGKSGKLAARPAAPEPAPGVDTDKKSKKKKKDNDPFGDGEITPPPSADPTTEAADTGKKSKKKKKDNDPFGDGEITPAPVAEPTKKEKEKAREKEAAPAADPAATATEEPSKKDKKKAKEKEKEQAAAPAADPAATPDAPAEDTGKKSKKEKKKEAEAAADPTADPSAEPTTDPGKKSKKKKKGEEDPFGDS